MSPSEYILKRKLTQASFMLRETSRPITDISLMFGFEHQTAFSRSFKRFTGTSPIKYRFSEMRDMNNFCPSETVKDVPCIVNSVSLNNKKLKITKNKIIRVNFGMDFLMLTINGSLLPKKNLFIQIMDFIFKQEDIDNVTIYGEQKPGIGCDTILNIIAGDFVNSDNSEYDSITVSGGNYICFTFSGTPEELMSYHTWARGHGLHKYGAILRNSSSLASFHTGFEPGIFISYYYLPCDLVRQT
ncbi:AraC family transcriptional regulator [Salmonella enterica subsp. enterica serovar Typhimurium]|nr:AraC family transcriptional regulator [Salmonella enterica subsp. enterica serovar Typhimurium]